MSDNLTALIKAAKAALDDFEVMECQCDEYKCNRCHGHNVLYGAIAAIERQVVDEIAANPDAIEAQPTSSFVMIGVNCVCGREMTLKARVG